ncbi:hypothetical protein MF672_020335 [Actinomadura sp. ATCC 31491]|uniref:Uncharacterized protein n=1 Tax=Actinomadura luzonensis TaxID=2805427 RepID=A0ABT0FUV8_9ACTN|nr:hypothetical protein [Actinomadura luzonensis]MCK2216128.1 hypothetical protein [Actinomadura luzonensis]
MVHLDEWMSRATAWASGLAGRADRAICQEQDERAAGHGWTVTRTGFGARRYRDPRFAALKAARTGSAARAGSSARAEAVR